MASKELIKQDKKEIGWNKVYENTPKEFVRTRQGRGNTTLAYVETGYMIKRLNELFNYLWDFKIIEQKANETEVIVLGELTIYVSPEIKLIKTQYGSSDIKRDKLTKKPISIGDDLKAAGSDALKKCASLIGIASDVYWGGEVTDMVETTENATEDTTEPSEPKRSIGSLASDGQRKMYFAVAKAAGYESEKAKDLAKAAFKLESFTEITKDQLEKLITYMTKKAKQKQEEEDLLNKANSAIDDLIGDLLSDIN